MGAISNAWAQQAVPALTGRVVDLADILSPQTEQALTAVLTAHEEETSNQVAVLTVQSLEGEVIEEFALRVARSWALGTREFNNGVLLVVAVQDRMMRIEVGYGLEGDLPDATAASIIRHELRPRFREGDFDNGVKAGVTAILGSIEGTYEPPLGSDKPPFWFGLLFMIIPSLFVFVGVTAPGCTRWFIFVFIMPFMWFSGFALFGHVVGGFVILAVYIAVFIWLIRHPKVRAANERLKAGKKAKLGPFTLSPGVGGSGGWSSGGGFSGGGGSFGGGGASGGW